MSIVSARLGRRRMAVPATQPASDSDSGSGTLAGAGARLADLRPGTTAKVVDIDRSMEPSTVRRLSALGFVPGGEVTVLRRAPLGDPMVFQVTEYEIALRKEQAVGVRVQPAA